MSMLILPFEIEKPFERKKMADEFHWNRFEATINYESIVSTSLWLLGILVLQTNVNDNF